MKVIVSQIGAREHYVVARALHQQGMLAGLVTDWYAFGRSGRQVASSKKSHLGLRSTILRRLSSVVRHSSAQASRCAMIPDELVQAFPIRSLYWKWRVRQLTKQGRLYEAYAQTDCAFATAVAGLKLPVHDVFFGYSYGSLEMLAAAKQCGVLTVLGQIDPGGMEFKLVAEEMKLHPPIAGLPSEFPTVHFDRNRREWELVDVIIVNSEWSREALVQQGANPAKIEILPLAYEPEEEELQPEALTLNPQPSTKPLRVLWLGQVNVRKGIHYLMMAARQLESENIHFDVVGSLGILPGAVALAPRNMTFHGSVSRNQAAEWYRQSDVFVLPTLSDGFALTQLEALAHGLPVITTPNCGQVVADGKTGFIIPPRDASALANAILKFTANRNLSASMSLACREAVKAYSIETYGKFLVKIINRRLKSQTGDCLPSQTVAALL